MPGCPICEKALRDYRAHPGKFVQLTPEQELQILRSWHAAGHPDFNQAVEPSHAPVR